MSIAQTNFYKKLLGRQGERKAKVYLRKKGYKIIEKNYRTKFAEADLIALYGDLLVFIEVKTRTSVSYGEPCEAVDYSKQKKYIKLAQYYMLTNKIENKNVRFDVIEVLNGDINHIENAF